MVFAESRTKICDIDTKQRDALEEFLVHGKVKVKLSHYTPWRRLGGEDVYYYSFLTSALNGGEWSASRPSRALPQGKDPRYPLDRRLGGPQSWSGKEARGKNHLLVSGIELPSPGRPVHRHCTD
jgi:hypothetical protein